MRGAVSKPDQAKLEAMAAQDTDNFTKWLRSPGGLSATGFGLVSRPKEPLSDGVIKAAIRTARMREAQSKG